MHLRKPFTIITANISRFSWLFIAFIPFMFPEAKAITLFFLVYAIINLSMAMAGNSWISWMADAIPTQLRGRYFSRRNLLITIVNPTGVVAGKLYDFFKANYNLQLVDIHPDRHRIYYRGPGRRPAVYDIPDKTARAALCQGGAEE